MSELILRTRELTRRYGRTLALDRASLSVEKGQILGLVGRNGAGKTTLIRLISGQSRPTSGVALQTSCEKFSYNLQKRNGA